MRVALDPESQVPPFEQVRSQIAAQISEGTLDPGTRLPTVRGLAGDLGLAVNTVARVYRELEADGLVRTAGRNGTVVAPGAGAEGQDAAAATDAFVREARRLGLTVEEAVLQVREHWNR